MNCCSLDCQACLLLRRFICVSHSEPEDRVHVLTMQGLLWQLLKVEQLPKNKLMFYAYIFEKVA